MTTDKAFEINPEFNEFIRKECEMRFSGKPIIDILFTLMFERLSAKNAHYSSPEEIPNTVMAEIMSEAQTLFVLESSITQLIDRCNTLEEQVSQLTSDIKKMTNVIDIMNSVDDGK